MQNLLSLPITLQSAELLSGNAQLRGCSPVALLATDSPVSRAEALPIRPNENVIVSGITAAWVWGAMRALQLPIELAVDFRLRVSIECAVPHKRRELMFQNADLARLGEVLVTTPPRTAFELMRSHSPFTTDIRVACRLLLTSQPDGSALLEEILAAHPRSPNVRLARTRLAEMY